jgi:hypothetical protein
MPDTIEESKSARAMCRTCRQKIDKAVLRFGEETVNQFDPDGGPAYVWHHLKCAAGRFPAKVTTALAAFQGTVPNREEIDAAIAGAKPAKAAKGKFPYAERAATGRSKCIECDEPIEKGKLRVAVEREVDTGSFTTTGAGYLHPACANANTGDEALLEKVKANSPALNEADVTELSAELK